MLFLMYVFVAINLNTEDFGMFSFFIAFGSVLSILVQWGFPIYVLKEFSIVTEAAAQRSMLIGALACTMALFFCVVIFFYGLNSFLRLGDGGSSIYYYATLLSSLMAILNIISASINGLGKNGSAIFVRYFLPFFLFLLFCLYRDSNELIFYINLYIACYFLSSLTSLFIVLNSSGTKRGAKLNFPVMMTLFSRGRGFILIGVGAVILNWTDIILIKIILGESSVANYTTVSRLVLLVPLILVVVNAVATPKLAKLYKQERMHEFESLVRSSSYLYMLIAVGWFCIFIFFGEFLLKLFGGNYYTNYSILLILLAGQLISLSAGAVAPILSMTNHQSTMQTIMMKAAFLNIILSIPLTYFFFFFGSATATTISIVWWNLFAMRKVKQVFGFWTMYIPKILVKIRR